MNHIFNLSRYLLISILALLWASTGKAQYCAPQYAASCQGPSPYTADFINNFSTSGGITNITNNNSGCNFQTNNFIYYNNLTVTATQGCSFNVSMQCGPEFAQGFAIWIDWNSDFDYTDAGELVYSSPTSGYQTFTGTIQVPASVTPGVKRMRVRCSFATVPNNPCTLQGGFTAYGEVEEYNVEVVSGNAGAVQVQDQTICAGTSTQITATAQGIIRWYLNETSNTQIGLGPTFTTPVLNQTTTYWVQSTFGPCTTPRVPVTITVIPPFAVTVSASQNPVCAGTPFTLTATAAGSGLTYNWSPAASILSTLQNTATASIPANTAFTVTATDASGCTGTGTLTVNANQAPQITVTATPSTICEGQQTALTTSGGGPNYSWTPAAGLSSTTGPAVGASPTVTTTYVVTSPASAGTCAASGSVTVTVNPLPVVNAGADFSICSGATANLSASGAASYSWSPAPGMTTPNAANTSVTPAATTIYTVTGTSAAGCSATDNVTVTVHALPVANPGNGAANCSGTGAQLNGSGGTSYQWSPATGLSSTTISNPLATPATTTNYTLVVTDANGCISAPSAPITVTVFQQPAAPSISASGPVAFCQGGTVTLSAPTASSYLWSTGASTQSITVNQTGNYTVQITDANGCTSPLSAPFPVTVHALPAAPVINADGPLTFCDGGSVNLTATGNGTFAWNTGASTASIPVNSSGSFTVTLTDANGCQATSGATIVTEQAPLSAPLITPSGSLSFCPGGSVTLTAPSAAQYLWSNGATTQSINVNQTGTYNVIITDAAGCVSPVSANTNTIQNPTPATPVVSALGNYPVCTGQTAQLTGPAAAQYNWSNGAVTQTINISTPGALTLTITDANGCVSAPSAPFQVSFFPLPAAPSINAVGPSTFCEGETVTLSATANGEINWNNGMNGAQIQVGNSGQYTATVTDNNGCESNNSSPVQVNVIPSPANASISLSGPAQFCQGDSVLLTANPAPQYTWSTGATSQSIWVHQSGVYSVQIGGTTCPPDEPQASREITVNPIPVPVISASTNRDCLPVDISFGFTTAGNGPFSYLWRLSDGSVSTQPNPTFEFDRAGFYDVTLTLTDVIGCTATLSEKDFIEILPRAIPALTIYPRITTDSEPTVTLVSQTLNADSIYWNLGPLGEYYGDTITITLPDTGTWPVEYTVGTSAGCEVILKDEMRMVEDFTVYIPNGFSPNADDLNDIFIPVTRGIDPEHYQFMIFNRWGEEVFSTTKLWYGWDGANAPIDTYIYKVIARGLLGEDKEFSGSITLIR